MRSTGAGTVPTDANPSTLDNAIGVGYDSADTNWHMMFNGATGTATKVDTGLPRPTADRTKLYELMLFSPPGSNTIHYSITDLSTFAEFAGTFTDTAKMPVATLLLGFRIQASVGGTSSVVGVKLNKLYIETDF